MTRKELREVLDQAVGQPPRVDLAEAAWTQGVGMRRRRRAVLAGGGALLTAAAVVGALVISGGIAPDQDVAPAVPTSTPGPTQVEPGPVDLTQARTYLFNRAGTSTDLEASSLELLSGQDVPAVADLTGSSWELVPMDRAGEAQGFIEIDLAGPDDAGAAEPTMLSFVQAENGDTLLSLRIDDCGGATFQEDLTLGADGRFAGQDAGTEDIGCSESVQMAEDFWMDALPAGGWLHQPHADTLLLSVVPEDAAAPSRRPTDSEDTDDGASRGDPASWRLLDPTAVTVESQTIRIGVTRAGCSGGRTGRVLEPIVTYENDRVLIRTNVEELESGAYACPGNEEVEVQVTLEEPLGNRDLFDAACQDSEYPVPCDSVFQWAYPRGEPLEIMADPYFVASAPQDFVDWGSHVVWVEVIAEREVDPRYPASVIAGEAGREVDLHLRDVMWSHPDAVTTVTGDEVISLEVSPGWADGHPAVLESDTRLEVGHVYTLVLVDSFDDDTQEQYLDRLLGSVTEFTTHDARNELLLALEDATPHPDRGPRPGEAWDARFIRVSDGVVP